MYWRRSEFFFPCVRFFACIVLYTAYKKYELILEKVWIGWEMIPQLDIVVTVHPYNVWLKYPLSFFFTLKGDLSDC